MAEDKTKQETIYLSVETVTFVQNLANLGIFGTSKGAIYKHLITDGINTLIKDDFVKKTIETRKLLDKK